MIDTAEKRLAMLGFGRAGFTLPLADGSFDAFDRMHLLGGYFFESVVVQPDQYPVCATLVMTPVRGTLVSRQPTATLVLDPDRGDLRSPDC